MNIIDAIEDRNLFRPFLADKNGSLDSWSNWRTALCCLNGLPVERDKSQLVRDCTGRDVGKLPKGGFQTALFLTGRRSGKSRTSAIVGAFEAVLSGREKQLAKGETGLVAIIAPTKKQARVVRNYLRAIFDQTALLRQVVVDETQDSFELSNGISVEILAGDWRTVRGYTLLSCIVDEVCFMGLDAESRVKNDSELIRAVRPSLATSDGKLICISSPYAERGWAYRTWKTNWGNDSGRILVWRAPSRVMNPLLPQSIVDEAIQEDAAAARSEYYAEWRQDVQNYLPREVVEVVVVKGRKELLPKPDVHYVGFCDVSGGRSDSAALGIGHRDRDSRTVIVDFLKEYRPPFSPYAVAGLMADELKKYRCSSVVGDKYAAEYTAQAFQSHGIAYRPAEKNKSELYLELIGTVCSRELELLDNERLVVQLAGLERRTRSGGRDIVDHAPNQHDDLANTVAGVAALVATPKLFVGAF